MTDLLQDLANIALIIFAEITFVLFQFLHENLLSQISWTALKDLPFQLEW